MKVLGFNFSKIYVEKTAYEIQDLKINTKIDISDISEAKASFFKLKEEVLSVNFNYGISYDPNYAKIELKGAILVAVDSKIARETIKQWKEKVIPEDFRIDLFNIILKKSTLKALDLENEMNLPPHIPFPLIGKPSSSDSTKNN